MTALRKFGIFPHFGLFEVHFHYATVHLETYSNDSAGEDSRLLPRPAAAGEAQAAALPLRHPKASVSTLVSQNPISPLNSVFGHLIYVNQDVNKECVSRRNLEAWRRELEDILDVAADDSEPWVQMLAELMKTYPSSGQAEKPGGRLLLYTFGV